jgi:methionine biosynthesis protein MetW
MARIDEEARGLVTELPSPLRYSGQDLDPAESTAMIASMIPSGARVLDVGCGTGSVSRLIIDARGCTVLGLEPDADRAAAARANGIEIVGAQMTEELIPQLGLFDVVLFADVLEHLVDPFEALRLAQKFLHVGGAIVASLPNIAHWTVRLDLLRGHFDYQPVGIMDATHLRWFTRRSLYRLFTQAGYRVVEIKASAGMWMEVYQSLPWRWLPRRVLRKLLQGAAYTLPTLFGCQYVLRAEPKRPQSTEELSHFRPIIARD